MSAQDARFQEDVARELAKFDVAYRGPITATPRFDGYHEAAAVLAAFDLATLAPSGISQPDRREDLVANSILISASGSEAAWTLRADVRAAVLAQLATPEVMIRALDANPGRTQGALQQIFESYIHGTAAPLKGQGLEELAATFEVAGWLASSKVTVPARELITAQSELASLLRPFEDLAGRHFRGRRRELKQLRDYVEVLPPDTALERVVNWFSKGVREIFDLHERPPLLIFGPGGMGKSTLMARFVLEHVRLDDSRRFPFVYLDFDRPELAVYRTAGLRADEPLSLLIEAVRQLGIQYPQARAACERTRENWSRELAEAYRRSTLMGADSPATSVTRRLDHSIFLANFVSLLSSLDVQGKPLLFILDTFEEVQYSSRAYVDALWDFLGALQAKVPRLRVVIAGRATVDGHPTENLPLDELDHEAAQGYLESHGVVDSNVARTIAAQVGGNPLTLRLAAECLEREGPTEDFLRDLQGKAIQRQLFRRFLEHIHDTEVRKLSHPGLVLRRLTPGIIRDVLAGPCEVEVESDAKAQALFEELSREVALVTPDADGAVRHRPELRRVMLRLLIQESPKKVEQLDRAAVAYYVAQPGLVARAEELYHRLRLQQDSSQVDARWLDGVEPYLTNALPDLAPAQQAYLASRLNLEVSEEVRASASLDAWERDARRRVHELLGLKEYDRAIAVIHERGDRARGTRLDLLEAGAWFAKGELDRAQMVLHESIAAADHSDSPLLAELRLTSARVSLQQGQADEARAQLAQADHVSAANDGSSMERLNIAVMLAMVEEAYPRSDDGVAETKARVLERARAIEPEDLAARPAVITEIAGLLGDDAPDLLKLALDVAGLAGLSQTQRRTLARAVSPWTNRLRELPRESRQAAARLLHGVDDAGLAPAVRTMIETAEPKQVAELLASMLEASPPPPEVATVLARVIRRPSQVEPMADSSPQPGDAPPSAETASTSAAYSPGIVRLPGAEMQRLHSALLDAFPARSDLEMMLHFRLDRRLDTLSFAQTMSATVYEVLKHAEAEGWLAQLIAAARDSNPTNASLIAVAQSVGLAAGDRATVQRLERIVDTQLSMDISTWRARLGEIEPRVCRVEVHAGGRDFVVSGFLVGPRAVLTAFHAVEPVLHQKDAPDLVCRFDYRVLPDGTAIHPGSRYRLARRDWLIDASPRPVSGTSRSMNLESFGCAVCAS
jgi:hypothetical protein